MIVKENIEIGGRVFVKTYSDGGFYIERDGGSIRRRSIRRSLTEPKPNSPWQTRLNCSEKWG